MGRTGTVLTLLMIALTLISGWILLSGAEQAQLLEEQTARLSAMEAEKKTQAERLTQAKQRARELDDALAKAVREGQTLQTQLTDCRQQLEASAADAQRLLAETQALRSQLTSAQQAQAQLQKEKQALSGQLSAAQADARQLKAQQQAALADLERAREAGRDAANQVETWEQAYAQLQEEAAQAAMAYEQQLAERPAQRDDLPDAGRRQPVFAQ